MTSSPPTRQLVLLLALAVALLGLAMLLGGCSETGPQADPILTLRVVSGNEQSVVQGDPLPEPIVVEVRGFTTGEGVADVPVSVAVLEGDGRLAPGDRRTGPDGRLELAWTLGSARNHSLRLTIPEGQTTQATVRATTTFRYVPPETIGDGWPTAALDPASSRAQSVLAAIDAIRDGTYTKVHSLLLVHQGELVFETYFPGQTSQGASVAFDRDTPHEAQSATKSFRSLLIGLAIDHGFIQGTDQSLRSLFPQYESLFSGTKNDINVEHILTMSSGIQWNEFAASPNILDSMYQLHPTRRSEFVLQQPMQYVPGSQWVYNTGASQLIGDMVVEASGMPLATFVRQYYSDLVESAGPPGIAYPLGATILPRDMAKLGQVFLADGMWKTTRVVSGEWVEESIQPRFTVNGSLGYGYQWWSRQYSTSAGAFDAYYAAGNGGQYIIVVDDLELVAVFTGGHFGSAQSESFHGLLARYVLPAFDS